MPDRHALSQKKKNMYTLHSIHMYIGKYTGKMSIHALAAAGISSHK